MGNQLKKIKRNQEMVKSEKAFKALTKPPQPQMMPAKEIIEAASTEGFKQGVHIGLEKAIVYGVDVLEKTLEETKGVGDKLGDKIRKGYHDNLNNVDFFNQFNSKDIDGEIIILPREAAELKLVLNSLREVFVNNAEATENKLTTRDILSILNLMKSPTKELLDFVTNNNEERGE